MRRFAFLITVAGVLSAGCNAAQPTAPSPDADAALSVKARNDTTPPAEASAEGGIMIGSGT